MPDESLAAGLRAIAIGIGLARCAEVRPPGGAAIQAVRVLERVRRFVPHDRHARCARSTFDRMHLRTLESHESGVSQVEGNRKSGNSAWREPLFCEPHVRTYPQRAIRELHQQPTMTEGHPCNGLRQTQLPKAQREQPLVAPPGPWGTLGWPVGHPHIQRPSSAGRNSHGAVE